VLITEQSISADQLRATASFAAEQIGTSPDRVLGYARRPQDPAYRQVHELAAAEIFRPTLKDLTRLRYRLRAIEERTRSIRALHRGLPAPFLTAAMVRQVICPGLPTWTARLLSAWTHQHRRRINQVVNGCAIECCLLDSTLRKLRESTGAFAGCTSEDVADQIEHLLYTCIELLGVRIAVVADEDRAVRRVLDHEWARFQAIILFDDSASLRRDNKGNRFLYDAAARSDARPMLSVKAAAHRLGISSSTLYQLVARRQIAHFRVGGKVLLDEADLNAFRAACRVAAASSESRAPMPPPLKHIKLRHA
jgi:excisionase family DNA binding protein